MVDLTPQMSEANIDVIWKSIKDPTCLAWRPVIKETERALDEMMPPDDIMPGKVVSEQAEQKGPLTEERRRLLAELFDNLEVVHDALAQTCSIMARLSRSLNLSQLELVLRASIRPLVQLNALGGLFDKPKTGLKQSELPDDIGERVRLTLTADPTSKLLAKEQPNSPTWLLAATFTYKVLKKFCGGCTQQEIQEHFNVWPKQLTTCITSRKYLGGSDCKATTRNGRHQARSHQQASKNNHHLADKHVSQVSDG